MSHKLTARCMLEGHIQSSSKHYQDAILMVKNIGTHQLSLGGCCCERGDWTGHVFSRGMVRGNVQVQMPKTAEFQLQLGSKRTPRLLLSLVWYLPYHAFVELCHIKDPSCVAGRAKRDKVREYRSRK